MYSRAALLLLVTMLSSSCAAAKVAPPTFGTAERKFALRLGSYVKASPAMSKDGTTVYVGTGEGCATGANTMYAINTATGTPRWSRFAAAGPSNATCLKSPCYCALDSSPSLDSDGNIYFGSMYGGSGGYFQKYDKNGNRVWEENMLLWVIAKPLIGDEDPRFRTDATKDVIFLGSEDGNFNAWYKNGTKKWQVSLGASVYGGAAIGPGVLWSSAPLHHPTLYVGTYVPANSHGIFFAISPVDGKVLWKHETTGLIKSTPAVSENGHIYVGDYDSKLYAYHPNGTVLWTFPLWGPAEACPTVGKDGTIYTGAGETDTVCPPTGCFFYAINPDGTLKWKYQLNPVGGNRRGTCQNAPTIGPDGTIYAACSDEIVYAFNPDGTLRWKFQTNGENLSGPAIGPDGTVYFGSNDANLYAVYRPCHPGYYCPPTEALPVPCKAGLYNNSTRAVLATECSPCPAGRICASNGTSTPALCPAGQTCAAGSAKGSPCIAGSYCPAGSVQGTICPAGNYCPANAAVPTPCTAGFFCTVGARSPKACPLGFFCPAGAAKAMACDPGSYTPHTKATKCDACPPSHNCINGIDYGPKDKARGTGLSVGAIAGVVGGVVAAAAIGAAVAYKMNSGENACDTNELLGERFRSNLLADTDGQRKSRLEMDRKSSERQAMLAGAIPAEEDRRHSAM